MTFAPRSLLDLQTYWVLRGGVSLGIVGDAAHQARASYHNGRDVIQKYGRTCANDYTICHPRDVAGLSDAASAIDLGPLNGSYRDLRSFTEALAARLMADDPLTRDIREVIGTTDGATVSCWISGQATSDGKPARLANCADRSHLTHTHISWFRDSENRDKTAVFRAILEGDMATISYKEELWDAPAGLPFYDAPNGKQLGTLSKAATIRTFGAPLKPDKSTDWNWRAGLVGTAQITGTSGTFMVWFQRSQLANPRPYTPPPPDCSAQVAQARGAALEAARAAAIDAVGKAIDALPR
jgi:hypothetical protein